MKLKIDLQFLKKPLSLQFIKRLQRSLLGVALFLALIATFYVSSGLYMRGALSEGDIALRDIYAPQSFTYPGEIDEKVTKRLTEEAAKQVEPLYDKLPDVWEGAETKLATFFDKLAVIREAGAGEQKDMLSALQDELSIALTDMNANFFLDTEQFREAKEAAVYAMNELVDALILTDENKEMLIAEETSAIMVRDLSTQVEKKGEVAGIIVPSDIPRIVSKILSKSPTVPEGWRIRKAIAQLLQVLLKENLATNPTETLQRRKAASDSIRPYRKPVEVKKNELILAKGERVTKIHLNKLSRLNQTRTLGNVGSYLAGVSIIILILILVGIMCLFIFERKILSDTKSLLLISFVTWLTVAGSQAIAASPLPTYLIPIPAAAMLLAVLLGFRAAYITTVILSIIVALVAENRFEVALASLIGGSAGIYFAIGTRRRAQLVKAGFLAGVASFIGIVGIGCLNRLHYDIFAIDGGWGLLNGILSSFVVMGLLPLFEHSFKMTTNITLLELSDLNHPLLKELILKAPGTYHHSLIVGNLAEAACEAIGANSLLARVGSYYHDIGKTEKPEYFSENETEYKSRHENLAPSMSALIIINHVKDGVELAQKYNLDQTIVDFIEQHHGTSLIYYFYQRALEKTDSDQKLDEEEFRYPGPRPQSKEAAVVLLADAVEASSRTLSEPTPSRIRGLVRKIINNKFIDSQLDECDLTLKALDTIAETFSRILISIFHSRIEYPEREELQEAKERRNGKKKQDKK
ncbi:MAG: HDIG domain-containing protein [Candidatus Omnitrophica bacterium]|nr:HDIG domain-containing protein [Candidatus Omnitrophota bacterium]